MRLPFFAQRQHKYRAVKTTVDGVTYDSKLEANTIGFLRHMERAGKIRDLELQPKVYLTEARILYKPDARYFDIERGTTVYAEAKGKGTAVWRIKRRLFAKYGDAPLLVFKACRGRIALVEELHPPPHTPA